MARAPAGAMLRSVLRVMSDMAGNGGRMSGIFCLSLAAILLAANLRAADWPIWRGNKQRTGVYEGAKVRPPFVRKWQYSLEYEYGWGWHYLAYPIVVGGILYQYHPPDLLEIDGLSGTLKNTISTVSSEIIHDNGSLYFGSRIEIAEDVERVIAVKFRLSDRQILWSSQFDVDDNAEVVFPAGNIAYAFLSNCMKLHCLMDDDGQQKWSQQYQDNLFYAHISSYGDMIFLPSKYLYAIRNSANYPDIAWTYMRESNAFLGSSPVVSDGRVYFTTHNWLTGMSTLEAVDIQTGTSQWTLDMPSTNANANITVDQGRIFLDRYWGQTISRYDDKGSYASLVWNIPQNYFGPNILVNEVVYSVSDVYAGNRVAALNPENGAQLWLSDESIYENPYPAFSDGLLYYYCGHYVCCFGKPISVHLLVDKGAAVSGQTLTYTITLNSYGGPAASVNLVETLPAEVEFVSASDGGALLGSIVTWNGLAVTGNALRDVTVTVRVRWDLPEGRYILEPTACISYEGDPAYTNVESEAAKTEVEGAGGIFRAPCDLVASDSCEGVRLQWQCSKQWSCNGYRLYRSENPGAGRGILTDLPVSASIYMDAAAADGKTYYYVLTAVCGGLESLPGNETMVRHRYCPPTHLGTIRVYPNPFNARNGTVKFELAKPAYVRVYTFRGGLVWEGSLMEPGIMEWDGKSGGKLQSAGVYRWIAEGRGWQEKGTILLAH